VMHVPASPRLIVDDVTSEALAMRLAEQGGRLGLFSAEGGPFELMAGRYTEGTSNFELYLKAHSGDAHLVDRVGRAPICLRAPALTAALTVQPSVVAGLARRPGFRGRGLLARFLFSLPRSRVGRRASNPPAVTAETRAAYLDSVANLLSMPVVRDDHGESEPRVLVLNGKAREHLLTFKAELEPRLATGADLAPLQDWVNKLPGAVARIAGLLYLADNHEVVGEEKPLRPLDVSVCERAVQIGRYLLEHAMAAFGLMGSDDVTELARRILEWLRGWEGDAVTKRDIHRGVHRQVERATDLDPALDVLVSRGYLRAMRPPRTSPVGGRPASPGFEIHPAVKR